MITALGPVSSAAHGGTDNPWFPIAIGALVLAGAWIRYFKVRQERNGPITILLGISVICGVLIFLGIWQLLR